MKSQEELKNKWQKRQDWFISMIGKRVYRAPVSCQCESCKNGNLNGILVDDEMHADYLHACESEMRIRYSAKPLQS